MKAPSAEGLDRAVTAQANSFSWWLWPPYDVQQTFDDFVVDDDGFRIRLMGIMLALTFEAPGICPPRR